MLTKPHIKPIKKSEASGDIKSIFKEIQDTMGIPWVPANWQSYAMYPNILNLFWKRLKPVVSTKSFLHDAVAITVHAYQDTATWYKPSYRPEITPRERQKIERELDAFEFGNSQLLIQQEILSQALKYENRPKVIFKRLARPVSTYRYPEIKMIEEGAAPHNVKKLYQDIKDTLRLPLVNSDYKALAKWMSFFKPAWEDSKKWHEKRRYLALKKKLTSMANESASRFPVSIGEEEMQEAVGNVSELKNLKRMIKMFTRLLPGLIVNDALFHIGIAAGQSVTPPRSE